MYRINEINIENDRLVFNVSIIFADKSELVCTVPAVFPKTKEEAIHAIELREAAEVKKRDAAPILEAIKTEITPDIGKTLTAAVK